MRQGYAMMQTQDYVTYHSPQASSGPLQRSLMAPHYNMGPVYSPSPVSMASPPYQGHSSYTYGGYHTPPPTTPMPVLKQEFMAYHGPKVVGHNGNGNRALTYERCDRPGPEYQMPSPSAESDIHLSLVESTVRRRSTRSKASTEPKIVTVNEPINPADQIEFKTNVDELMKLIQKKDTTPIELQHPLTPVHTPKCDTVSSSCNMGLASPARSDSKARNKKWVCDGPNCDKAFAQKTHLDVHRRTHTGERPYKCDWPGCELTFSQRGNLKTHQRRHKNDKPYSCSICSKSFAQKGNVRSHEKTHSNLKPYTCRLGGCGKLFSQLGNMKTHQNLFHREILVDITQRFAKYVETGEIPAGDKELFDYFKEHYKNSNKGIKGRGKGRQVAPRRLPISPRVVKTEPMRALSLQPVPSQGPIYSVINSPASVPEMPRGHGYSKMYF